jgi:hypothetical protein
MTNTQAFSRHIVSEVCSPPRIENRFAPRTNEGAERRKAHPTRCRAASNQRRRRSMPSGAAARTSGARSPSGALLRLSPGLSTPDSASGHASWDVVQAGVTRPRLSESSKLLPTKVPAAYRVAAAHCPCDTNAGPPSHSTCGLRASSIRRQKPCDEAG